MDWHVRGGGVVLLMLTGGLVGLVAVLRRADALQPSITEFCIAFAAVCCASTGAAMLAEGRKLFEAAQGPRGRQPVAERSASRR